MMVDCSIYLASIGWKNKNAKSFEKALYSIKYDLSKIELFHTNRGSEFKNEEIEKVLKTFNITRLLSTKGCPYDNVVAEAAYKIIKTEFAFNKKFDSLEELELELFDYVNWYKIISGYMAHLVIKHLLNLECSHRNCPKKC